MFRGRIPIDLWHIIKDLVRIIPLDTAIVDLEHSTILNNSATVGRSVLRRRQLLICHRCYIVLIAALYQAVHIDIGGGHINIPPGDIARGCLGGVRPRESSIIVVTQRHSLRPILLTDRVPIIIRFCFQAFGKIIQIHLWVAVNVDNTLLVTLGNRSLGSDKTYSIAFYACWARLGTTVDTDIPAGISDSHIAMEIADFAVYLHIWDSGISETIMDIDIL